MKIFFTGAIALLLCTVSAVAGDAAVFNEVGFSDDGKYYIFGEYGRTDKSYLGYAEIYVVNVADNVFVPGGVFRTEATSATRSKSGLEVYDALSAKCFSVTSSYNCAKSTADRVLYICDSPQKAGDEKIEFRDFTRVLGDGLDCGDDAPAYRVSLKQSVKGRGQGASSSFHIVLEKLGTDGAAVSCQTIGSPNIVRRAVTGYKIERILCDASRTSLVFVVQKTMEDKSGVLIRYMVETAKVRL